MNGAPILSRGFAPLLIALAYAWLGVWTWGTWPDVAIDFGRELYVPWRLSEGDQLYRDLSYFNGPLSPWLNALLFRLFGASVHTLFYANLVWLALLCVVLYRLFRTLGDQLGALVAVLVFLGVFAFGQQVGIGNYNFVAPYSHEATHGLLLCLLALAALDRAGARGRFGWVLVAGACVGLSLLTKLEMALAACASSCACLACMQWQRCLPRLGMQSWLLFFGAAALPPLAAGAFFPWSDALAAVVAPFHDAAARSAASLLFYRHGMGIDEPLKNSLRLLFCAAIWLVALAPVVLLAVRVGASERPRSFWIRIGVIYFVVLTATRDLVPWSQAGRALPLVCASILVYCLRGRTLFRDGRRRALAVGTAVLALVLLSKMLLNARFGQYGFVLAAPGLLLAIVALISWLPEALAGRANGTILRAGTCALGAVLIAVHLDRTAHFIDENRVVIGRGADAFLADLRGVPLRAALTTLEHTPADSTFAVFPEGVMLNFLARRRTPTPYLNFMPTEFALFGEARMLASFLAHPPDRIVLVHKDTSEYGYAYFGRDYALDWRRWYEANYHPGPLFGSPPLQPESRFGVQILLRNF